jgi:ankyrin repeat protein
MALLNLDDQSKQLNFQDKHGWSPLHYAASIGNSLAIRIVLERSPDTSLVVNHPIFGLCVAKEIAVKSLSILENSPRSQRVKELVENLTSKGLMRTLYDILGTDGDAESILRQMVEQVIPKFKERR